MKEDINKYITYHRRHKQQKDLRLGNGILIYIRGLRVPGHDPLGQYTGVTDSALTTYQCLIVSSIQFVFLSVFIFYPSLFVNSLCVDLINLRVFLFRSVVNIDLRRSFLMNQHYHYKQRRCIHTLKDKIKNLL